ncbi:hypothetical protein [Pseudomonas abieticivorans]|uniref:hypothetical protein n=1 Tax=Pseudomonas abieticivorans TaxID=2931382 RepID=UPI0020BDAF27|nr:hypothetical protein [Pseudomonas sp. PIA16]
MSYDSDLIDLCRRKKIHVSNLGPADLLFELIEKKYPFSGNRVAFCKLNNYKYAKTSNNRAISDMVQFIEPLQGLIAKTSELIYLGDNLTENAYLTSNTNLIKFISCFIEIPQSHYLLAKDVSWCINLSFENDIEFGALDDSQ